MTDNDTSTAPHSRIRLPLVIGAIVALVLVAAIVIVVVVVTRGDGESAPPAPAVSESAAAPTGSPADGDDGADGAEDEPEAQSDSVCGLSGGAATDTVTTPPDVEWEYFGTTAYPVSQEHGPAETSPDGYPYCFQQSAQGARTAIVGFKVLEHDGETALIDIALNASADGQSLTASAVYDLVWEDGDWKLDTSTATPLNFATIPDAAGYTPWGE